MPKPNTNSRNPSSSQTLTPTFADDPETLPPNNQRHPRARVIDIIPVNDELYMIKVWMEELDPVVDLFVIVESEFTFTFIPKPLYFQRNRDRFKKFAHKTLALFVHEMSCESRKQILQVKLYNITLVPEVHERSLGQPPSLATALLPTQDNQQQELNSSPKAPPPPTSAPTAKKRPTAAEVFENLKDKDVAYCQNWVRAANWTAAEIKIYKDTMKTSGSMAGSRHDGCATMSNSHCWTRPVGIAPTVRQTSPRSCTCSGRHPIESITGPRSRTRPGFWIGRERGRI
ncbi:hypothetical protein EC957_008223 [Mortierella hygrophila]|uniref:Uncharacterized protein n=1 Tax=Mortierella hygrophila TaxID=979708 RepID=A0A9P6K585_9FUNG|nr:hypothetical protein EC957_008223 [Mortierella hygrophila]